MRKILLFIWETAKIVIFSLAIIIPVRYYLVQPFFVRGASMEPNFDNGQYLVVNEIGYRIDQPERGDVIVFKYPFDQSQYYIKRIIGLPGEKVAIRDGAVLVNGAELDESAYLPESVSTGGNIVLDLKDGEYFVLGDNRQASSDSRQWGILPVGNIIGEVWLRAWPLNMAKIF